MSDFFALVFAILLIGSPVIALCLGPILNFIDRFKKNDDKIEVIFPAKFVIKSHKVYVFILVLLIIGLLFYYKSFYTSGQHHEMLPGILVVTVLFLLEMLSHRKEPKIIELSPEGFVYTNQVEQKIKWDEVKFIEFLLPNRNWSSQRIEITMNGGSSLTIHPYSYEKHRLLRRLFEELAKCNSVMVRVEDRGV